jgi:N-acetylneuraminic acid mutarotase
MPMPGMQYPIQNPVSSITDAQLPIQNYDPNINNQQMPTKGVVDPNCPNLFYHNQMVWFQFKSNGICFYDFNTKKWIPGINANNHQFLGYFRTAQLPDGSMLITGGSDGTDIIFNTVLLYHVDGRITAKQNMKLPRRAHCCIYNNGGVYVFGGVNNKGFLQDCERYNLQTGTWSDLDRMTKKRTLTSCCNFNSDSIFVFGGYSDDEKKELDLIERFDIKTNKFFAMSFKLLDRLQNPFVVQINPTEILIMGGYNDDMGDSANVVLMDVYNGGFKPLPNLNEKGWGIYPPIFSGGIFCLFMTGEDPEAPDVIDYYLKL